MNPFMTLKYVLLKGLAKIHTRRSMCSLARPLTAHITKAQKERTNSDKVCLALLGKHTCMFEYTFVKVQVNMYSGRNHFDAI